MGFQDNCNECCGNNDLQKTFKRLKGQPVEIITESGFKVCGIDVECDDDCVVIIDDKSRYVRLPYCHIDAIIESQMKLDCLCKDNDCDCD